MKDALGHGSNAQDGPAHQLGVGNAVPSHAATELHLFADNSADLHRQSYEPIMRNLQVKMDKGLYNPELAVKVFGYHANRAADAYAKEFGSPGQKGHQMFTPEDRRQAARMMESNARPELQYGNYRKAK